MVEASTASGRPGRAGAAYSERVTSFSIWPEGVEWRRLSGRLFWLELIRQAGGLLVVAAFTGAAWLIWEQIWVLVVGGALALATVVRIAFLRRSIRAWGYAERVDDLLVRHGRLVHRLSIVPYGRMQFVDVTAGPVERALGLATVQLHTAAAATDAKIPGLVPAEAARLRDRLAALGESRAEGL